MFQVKFAFAVRRSEGPTWWTQRHVEERCTGEVEEAAREQWERDGSESITIPITREEASKMNQQWFIINDKHVMRCSEPVGVFFVDDLWNVPNFVPTATVACVYSQLPEREQFLFPVGVGEIFSSPMRVPISHHVLCIVTAASKIWIWDPCGSATKFVGVAQVIADAFNTLGERKFTASNPESWGEEVRGVMTVGPQTLETYGVNGYCQTWTYVKAADVIQNGFPGALKTADDFLAEYPTLKEVGRKSAELFKPDSPETVKTNHISPMAAGFSYCWVPEAYESLARQGGAFGVMKCKELDFHPHVAEQPQMLAYGSIGGRRVPFTVYKTMEWDPHTTVPEQFWSDADFILKAREYGNDDQHSALITAFWDNPEKMEATCMDAFLDDDRIDYSDTRKFSEMKRARIIAAVAASRDDIDWFAFWDNFCRRAWKKNKFLAYREYKLLGESDDFYEGGFNLGIFTEVPYFTLSDDDLADPDVIYHHLVNYPNMTCKDVPKEIRHTVEIGLAMAKARGEEALGALKLPFKTDPKIVMMVLLHATKFKMVLDDLDEFGVHPSRETLTPAARELSISQAELNHVIEQLPAVPLDVSS